MDKTKIKRLANNKAFTSVLLIIVFGLIYLKGRNDSKQFREEVHSDPIIVIGEVQSVESKVKLGVIVKYQFDFEQNKYLGWTSSSTYASVKHKLVNRTFPVILNSKSPDKNQMLILPEDFATYNIKFPDSLSWLVQSSKQRNE